MASLVNPMPPLCFRQEKPAHFSNLTMNAPEKHIGWGMY
jgi:hypothetical protein